MSAPSHGQTPSSPPPAPATDATPSQAPAAAEAFVAKWSAHWPEWRVGWSFVPQAQRDVARAWLALLQEFTDAAWGGRDATPGLAKLAWWNEELLGWAKGARRHPLGALLQRQPVDWAALASSLRGLQATREAAPMPRHDDAGIQRFAAAVAAADLALLAASHAQPSSAGGAPSLTPDAAAVAALAADLIAERALLLGDPCTARDVLKVLPPAAASAVRVRRVQSAFVRERLEHLARSGNVVAASAWRSLRLAWRAARAAPADAVS